MPNTPNIHRAIFRQPGPELNPMMLKVPTPIIVEVFEIETKARYPRGITSATGKWTAREASTGTVFKNVGTQIDAYSARYRVAALFMEQAEPWEIDGTAETGTGFHLHYELGQPSLCGSKYHTGVSPANGLLLPELRACRRLLVPSEWKNLCEICQRLIDHTPAPGDKIRVRLTGDTGTVICDAEPDLKPGSAQRYVIKFADGREKGIVFTADEITLCMFDKDQPD